MLVLGCQQLQRISLNLGSFRLICKNNFSAITEFSWKLKIHSYNNKTNNNTGSCDSINNDGDSQHEWTLCLIPHSVSVILLNYHLIITTINEVRTIVPYVQ